MCVDRVRYAVAPCGATARRLADAQTDNDFRTALIDAWSMRSFVPSSGVSGHDHFFAAFAKFGGAASMGEMAADVVDRAGAQHERYIELMATFQGGAVTTLGKQLRWTGDMADFQRRLLAAGLPSLLPKARADIDAGEARMRALMHCGTPQASPGCSVTVRWLGQVTRTNPPGAVFAQMLFTAMLSEADPRVVGLNFVSPEDNPTALADYTLHMRMLDYLHGAMPRAKVSLHAGELTLGLVPPDALRFHVRQAVELAHAAAHRARRGCDVRDRSARSAASRWRNGASRWRSTSPATIRSSACMGRRIRSRSTAPPACRRSLSTDDEGVERIDRTHELQRAVTEFGLDWPTLVGLERNTLEYAFVAGASLWADPVAWRRVAACDDAGFRSRPRPHAPRSCRAARRRGCNGNWNGTWTGSAASRDADGFRSAEPILRAWRRRMGRAQRHRQSKCARTPVLSVLRDHALGSPPNREGNHHGVRHLP